jgi:type I restriction enzyme, S subunit
MELEKRMKNEDSILMSIKPKFVQAIFDGKKKFEFRRVIFSRRDIEQIIIYSSSPKQKIVGFIRVESILGGSPSSLWDTCKEQAGIDENQFFKYFEGKKYGYAIKIGDIRQFSQEINPRDLDQNFRPPQSFCYLKSDNLLLKDLKNQAIKIK